MSGWTEASLRSAASWQAFKEGKSLFESGLVTDAQAGSTGWQGAVKVGSRMLRVSVIAKSPTNIEARCPCSDNQRTGAVCAHAVATGLAALAPKSPQRSIQATVQKAAVVASVSAAWQILLPLNWRDALKRGKFAATLALSPDEEISPADDRLSAWLAKEKVAQKSILSLSLDGARVPAFLESVADHPRLAAGKDRLCIQIRSGERLRLAEADLQGDQIRLVPDADSGPWIEIGGSFWHIGEENVTRIGEGATPAELANSLGQLSQGVTVEIPTQRFFNQLESWQEWITFPNGSWLDSLHFVPATASIELNLEGSLQHLEAQPDVLGGAGGEFAGEVIDHQKLALKGLGHHPVEQLGIEGAIGFALGRITVDAGMHVGDALDHALGSACRPIDANHRRNARALRAADRILLVERMIPDAGPDTRIGKFEQHGGDAPHRHCDGILVDLPVHRVGRKTRRFTGRIPEVDLPAEVGLHIEHGHGGHRLKAKPTPRRHRNMSR